MFVPSIDLVPVVARSAKWRRLLNVIRTRNALLAPVGRDLLAHAVSTRSLVQLVNVTMMSDPWTFACLFFVGKQLYIYEIRKPCQQQLDDAERSCVDVLLYPPDTVGREIGVSSRYCELIESVSSRDIPIAVVFCCA